MKVAVLGGGVIGLTTALQLKDELRNSRITVIAADFDNIVSYVAAGIFRVAPSYSGPTETLTKRWIKDSYEYYDEIRKTTEVSCAGVTSISGYMFAKSSPRAVRNHWLEGLLPIYRRATEEEFELVGGSWKYGSFYSTLLTECSLYLPWIQEKLKYAGVALEKKSISSLKQLAGDYDIVMNCTGLGARELCSDNRMVAIRGQVLKVNAPWLKTFFYGELDTYIIPGFNGTVTLGGSRNFDSENLQLCPHESAAIQERCTNLIPSLKNAEVVGQKVGLRPHREFNVRVEAEHISDRHSRAMVVHNYGHGGYGVCTAPGTAKYAVSLAIDMHKSNSKL